MATLLYHIFLKSSLLLEIFLVEVKKYILSTFVSFQLVSRRISRAKEKTSLKRSKALCRKYRSVHQIRDSPSWRGELWIFLATRMTKNYKIHKIQFKVFLFINIFPFSIALLLHLRIYIIGLLIKTHKRFI